MVRGTVTMVMIMAMMEAMVIVAMMMLAAMSVEVTMMEMWPGYFCAAEDLGSCQI